MREAVIVSTARTPIGKAYRGALNNLDAASMGAHVIREAVRRAKLEPGDVDDVVMGAALQQGTSGYNLGRKCAVAAGLPVTVSGMTIDRQCASGLMAIATAAKQVVDDGQSCWVLDLWNHDPVEGAANDRANIFGQSISLNRIHPHDDRRYFFVARQRSTHRRRHEIRPLSHR